MNDDEDPITAGWDAISGALEALYGDQEPLHFGTVMKYALGGPDPLDGFSIYRQTEPVEHFHYVTFGFSELYEKESEDPEESGYGFELTFRLAHDITAEPPQWPMSLLQNLARYVFKTGNAFGNNHHLPLNSPIAQGEDTKINCVVIITDPELGVIATPNGTVRFLQLVGLCEDEYELIKDGYFRPVLDRVMSLQPLAVTDIYRQSILDDPTVRSEITSAKPEINQCESFGTHIQWTAAADRLHVKVGATRVSQIVKLMTHVLSVGKPIAVYGASSGIGMFVDDVNQWEQKDEQWLELRMTPDTAAEICATIQPTRAVHNLKNFPQLTLEIIPVDIKDADDKTVEVIG